VTAVAEASAIRNPVEMSLLPDYEYSSISTRP